MKNIHIKRYENDPQAIGCVEPEDGSWQLLIDHEGFPHFYIRTNVIDDAGQKTTGLFAVEDMLPEDVTIKDLMLGTFEGSLSPEEVAALEASGVTSKAPCPKV